MKKLLLYFAIMILFGITAWLGYYYDFFNYIALVIFCGLGLVTIVGFVIGVYNAIKYRNK